MGSPAAEPFYALADATGSSTDSRDRTNVPSARCVKNPICPSAAPRASPDIPE